MNIQPAAVAHGLEGVVDQIHQDLLQFAAIGFDHDIFRRFFHGDGDIPVFSLFSVEDKDICNDLFQVDILDPDVEFACEPKQLSCNRAAAFDRIQDGIDIFKQLSILAVLLLDHEQVLDVSAGDYMMDFRFRVLDADKAAVFFDQRIKPYVLVERSSAKLPVPMATKVGALRPTNRGKNIRADRNYYMMFANPDRHVQRGGKATLVIGDFRVEHLTVN